MGTGFLSYDQTSKQTDRQTEITALYFKKIRYINLYSKNSNSGTLRNIIFLICENGNFFFSLYFLLSFRNIISVNRIIFFSVALDLILHGPSLLNQERRHSVSVCETPTRPTTRGEYNTLTLNQIICFYIILSEEIADYAHTIFKMIKLIFGYKQ